MSNNDKTVLTRLNYEELLNVLNEKFIEYWTRLWKLKVIFTNTGRFYSDMVEAPSLGKWKVCQSRRTETAMNRLRLGHVGTAQHLHRFNMRDSSICQMCSTDEDISHFLLNCRRYNDQRQRVKRELESLRVEFNIRNLLGCANLSNKIQKKIQKILVHFLVNTSRISEL